MPNSNPKRPATSSHMVRPDEKSTLNEALAAESQTIALTPADQLEFWIALNDPVELTLAQKELSKLMRGERGDAKRSHQRDCRWAR